MTGIIIGLVLSSLLMIAVGGLSVLATVAVGVLFVAMIIALCLAMASLFAWMLGL